MALKFKYLLKVEGGSIDPKTGAEINNNKYFQMTENSDGTYTTEYGRVGCAKPQGDTYPLNDKKHGWDIKYKEKTGPRKNYKDITHLKGVSEAKKSSIIHKLPEVVALITTLQTAARITVSETYLVKSENVTQAQIDEAQKCINNLSTSFKHFGKDFNIDMFNSELKKLFTAIPRIMKSVTANLINADTKKEDIAKKIENEQTFLDSMAGQVITNTATADSSANKTLLESMGLEMELPTQKEFDEVKRRLGSNGHRLRKIFKVVNKTTQKTFDNNIAKSLHKKTDLLFHGSRSENWIFILQQGLKIRPSGAVYTGSLLGDAVYFANSADKSLGYVDGGRWTGSGNARSSVFMGLYEVRVGKPLEMRSKAVAITSPKSELFDKGYCSVHAYAGCDMGYSRMRMDEITIYNSDQSTIRYLLELQS